MFATLLYSLKVKEAGKNDISCMLCILKKALSLVNMEKENF